MTPEQIQTLAAELAKDAYSGMTADAAYQHLFAPRVTTTQTPTGLLLTAKVTARLLGPAKAEAIAAALKAAYPTTYSFLIEEGVNPLEPATGAFFAGLLAANVISGADVAAIQAAAVTTTTTETFPLMVEVFAGVAGFPNHVGRADFDTAWAAAGRT